MIKILQIKDKRLKCYKNNKIKDQKCNFAKKINENEIVLLKMISGLEVLSQLANLKIVRSDVMIRVRTRNLTIVCEFNFSGLPLHLRQKKEDDFNFRIPIFIVLKIVIV
jgi:hypothetical protein